MLAEPAMLRAPSSSAAGVLSYLEDDDVALKARALQKIYQIVDLHWAEISNSLPVIEELSEDSTFPAAELAAAIASKCFYHLQEYNDSLRLALCAGNYLDIAAKSEYVEVIIAKCIDEYKLLRAQQDGDDAVTIDPRMEHIIEQMFQRCYRDKCFEQAIGIALDTRRIDKLEEVVATAIATGRQNILGYTFNLCRNARYINPREFRLSVIQVLVNYYEKIPVPDFANVCFGLQYLDKPKEAAATLERLLRGSLNDSLLAYQIAFDLQETENQGFVLKIVANITDPVRDAASAAAVAPDAVPGGDESKEEVPVAAPAAAVAAEDSTYLERLAKLKRILTDSLDIDLTLNFLFKKSHADINILKDIKVAIEGRSSVLHNATVLSHAYMNTGTVRDTFLRENLEWLGKAKNWAKFSTVGSIGMVHKGHLHESMNLLQPYLPQGGQSASPYSEAGALYALGLIHANKGGDGDSITIRYLTDALRNGGNDEIVQHGACLGIGLAAMATANPILYDMLKSVLFTDSAIGGEAAALAIGLVMLGQSDSGLAQQELPELLNYLHDTSHEKIVRALSLSIAMMVYCKEESADVIIEQMVRNRDPIVRYGAMYAIGMAYCGTADNNSIRKLLHVAVSDVSDDVRRAAVTCVGFLMFRTPEAVPKLVSLLAESFNPHVRYGACMAIGISCAGTAFKDAIDILTPILEDPVDFVRQSAFLSMAMVLQQCSEARSPSVKKFRDLLANVVTDKHQPILAKSGAILAAGIIDAGGGNLIISMQSRAGFVKMGGAVGIMMFLQHWYWYPLLHFLSLSFSPTMLIGLNKDFDMPTDFELQCNAPPSMFAYPEVKEKKDDTKKLVTTAVLSTTVKTKARELRKEAKKSGGGGGALSPKDKGKKGSSDAMDLSTGGPGSPIDLRRVSSSGLGPGSPLERVASIGPDGVPLERVTSHLSTTSYLSVEAPNAEPPKPKKVKEASSFSMSNPSRLIPMQAKFVSAQVDPPQRYTPVRGHQAAPSGIVMLIDSDPTKPENVSKIERVALGQEEMAQAPEPFEWDPNDE